MFKAFVKGFKELFGGFAIIFGISSGFVGFIYLLVQTVKFFETIVGTTWAIILMCTFVVLFACVGHGLYRMSLYNKAKKKYDLNSKKREELLDKLEAEAGHRNIHVLNSSTHKYRSDYETYTHNMIEAEADMRYWRDK